MAREKWYLLINDKIVNTFYNEDDAKFEYEETLVPMGQEDKVELVKVAASTECFKENLYHGANGYLPGFCSLDYTEDY